MSTMAHRNAEQVKTYLLGTPVVHALLMFARNERRALNVLTIIADEKNSLQWEGWSR